MIRLIAKIQIKYYFLIVFSEMIISAFIGSEDRHNVRSAGRMMVLHVLYEKGNTHTRTKQGAQSLCAVDGFNVSRSGSHHLHQPYTILC